MNTPIDVQRQQRLDGLNARIEKHREMIEAYGWLIEHVTSAEPGSEAQIHALSQTIFRLREARHVVIVRLEKLQEQAATLRRAQDAAKRVRPADEISTVTPGNYPGTRQTAWTVEP